MFTEIGNLLSIWHNHVLNYLSGSEEPSPKRKPRRTEILMRQGLLHPFNIVVPVFGTIPILIKYFKPLVLYMYFTSCSPSSPYENVEIREIC